MNIWYVSKYIAIPGCGRAGGRGYLLMKEFAKAGHNVCMILSDSNHLILPPQLRSDYSFQQIDGMLLCWVRTFKYSVAKSLRRILSWLHFELLLLCMPTRDLPKPDVLIISSLSLLTILNGLRWRFQYSCRLVFEIRDIWPLTLIDEGGFSAQNIFIAVLAAIEKLGYQKADIIIGTMPNLAEHVSNVLGYQRPVYCIPMGIEALSIAPNNALKHNLADEYLPKHKFIVAHVGSIGIANALDTFCKCASDMRHISHIHFLLVGDGDLRNSYLNSYGHLENITFAPSVPKDVVPVVLSKCDLLYFSTHPSRVWRYGQSLNKIIDYMMSAKPIIGSFSGYPSMINEARCGSFVPAGDLNSLREEIIRYARMSDSERVVIGERGRQWLTENRKYEQLAKLYLGLLAT